MTTADCCGYEGMRMTTAVAMRDEDADCCGYEDDSEDADCCGYER